MIVNYEGGFGRTFSDEHQVRRRGVVKRCSHVHLHNHPRGKHEKVSCQRQDHAHRQRSDGKARMEPAERKAATARAYEVLSK